MAVIVFDSIPMENISGDKSNALSEQVSIADGVTLNHGLHASGVAAQSANGDALHNRIPSGVVPNRSQESAPQIHFRTDPALLENAASLIREIVAEQKVSRLLAELLLSRGIRSVEESSRFLRPTLKDALPNPNQIKGIEQAAAIIIRALEEKKQITVYSDFDVDGVTAGAQLYLFLRRLQGRVNHYAPNRFTEGYGFVAPALDKLIQAKTELLVTVDCGITNLREVRRAKQAGMQVVIVDHHQPAELPDADAIVDPAQPGCPFQPYKLCAAGLVWMLLVVMRQQLRDHETLGRQVPDPKEFLDLAALGTVCDMVPLIEVNRVLAARGLDALRSSVRPGIVALKKAAGSPLNHRFSSGHIGFGLGPRINAAGRMEDAKIAFDLLTTGNSQLAETIAKKLDSLNVKRQSEEQQSKEECIARVLGDERLLSQPALALYGAEYHAGVIGIVAQRLVEFFFKPTAVMASGEAVVNGKLTRVIKGSVRSVPGFHVANVLEKLRPILLAGGGHAEAGGFTILPEMLTEFQNRFISEADTLLNADARVRTITADAELPLSQIDFATVTELEKLQPFGVGNPAPVFVSRGVTVDSVKLLGEKHLRLSLKQGGFYSGAVAWNMQGHPLLEPGSTVSILFSPEINSFQGVSSVQLTIREVWREDT